MNFCTQAEAVQSSSGHGCFIFLLQPQGVVMGTNQVQSSKERGRTSAEIASPEIRTGLEQ